MDDEHFTLEVTATWRVTHSRQITASSRRELEERFCAELIADGIISDESDFAYLRDSDDFTMTLEVVE